MKFVQRYLPAWSLENEMLAPKMIFIAGPRQCGKTTLIEKFLSSRKCEQLCYNWDTPNVRELYRQDPTFFESQARLVKKRQRNLWVGFDEIHKRAGWKNILKGYFDQFGKNSDSSSPAVPDSIFSGNPGMPSLADIFFLICFLFRLQKSAVINIQAWRPGMHF